MNYKEINKDMWDKWSSEDECVWTVPMSHDDFLSCKRNEYNIYLASQVPVPKEWLGDMHGLKILALASGGGQQGPYFVANGAEVTVMDISEKQIEAEKYVAERENYDINTVQGDMTRGLPFEDDYFDIIFNPVSNCYIESLDGVWSECNRVLKPGGKLMTGFPNPTIFLFKMIGEKAELKYEMPYNPFKQLTAEERDELFKTDGAQFGHSFDEQIGGLIRSNFDIIDFYEDYYPLDTGANKFDTHIGAVAAYLTKYMPIFFCVLATKRLKS